MPDSSGYVSPELFFIISSDAEAAKTCENRRRMRESMNRLLPEGGT